MREVEKAESALQSAVVVVIVGQCTNISMEEVADSLTAIFDLPTEVFSFHRHNDGGFLIYFAAWEDRRVVLDKEFIQTPFFRLLVKPWSRRTGAIGGSLGVHVNIDIEGMPANTWSMAAAETILAPNSWVERLDPVTCHPLPCGHAGVPAIGMVS